MFIRFSVIAESGIEVFACESKKMDLSENDPQLVAGFMNAIQSFSEAIQNPIRQIQFANMMLYVRTYGDFGLQLLFEEYIEGSKLEYHFDTLSKLVLPLLVDQRTGKFPSREEFLEQLSPVLDQLQQDPLAKTELAQLIKPKTPSKIAIVGLAKAGKSSLKNIFFNNWSREMVNNIRPTIGVEVSPKFLDFLDQNILLMDFGGQKTFISNYLLETRRWENTSILIFVVDIQAIDSFEEAKNYLADVWKLVLKVNDKKPKLSIYFHKCDIDKRSYLTENINKAMYHFKEFVNEAVFHLTTIEDNSGYIALIKTLYFSLPEVLLKRLFEDKFLVHFEQETLPKYSQLIQNRNQFNDLFPKLKKNIREDARITGFEYGQALQESWLKYIIGEWKPEHRLLSSKTLTVSQEGQFLYISIPDWSNQDWPNELTTVLLDGMLEGVLKTFHLDPPQIVKEGILTTWKITL